MNYTTEMYTFIKNDIQNRDNYPGRNASRMLEYVNGIIMVFSIEIVSLRREAYISLADFPEGIQFPKWRGISIDIAQLPVYGSDRYYVRFVQLPESEDYIFEIVVEDLRQAVARLQSSENGINTIIDILTKWKRFFQSEKGLVMTDELQEGLYGELIFLEKLLTSIGTSSVANWVGGVKETHVVIGGPPCQGFSNANRQRATISTNNGLVKEYVRAIIELKPSMFVMENVSMLKSDVHRFYCTAEDEEMIHRLQISCRDDILELRNHFRDSKFC